MIKADLTISEVEAPAGNWCSSGHNAPETFKSDGPNGDPKPTRFFSVSNSKINNIYCEICLCIANFMSKGKK